MYRIEVSPAADRDISRLKGKIIKRDLQKLREAVNSLAGNPRPHGVRKIKGEENAYRIRVGHYRVVYEIYDKENMLLILQIVRRSETTYQ